MTIASRTISNRINKMDKKYDIKQVPEDLQKVYDALNTLKISGYYDCKTFSNCMEVISFIIKQTKENIKGD